VADRTQPIDVPGVGLGPQLTIRQRAVLKLIVQDYVTSGRPVGSKSLIERYQVGVSSATIRNEMAELEHSGFVEHLHTSGGRVPTVDGYRFFVQNLMDNVELPAGEQIMIRHQFRQVERQLEGWMELAASVLAETAGNVSVVTAPRTAAPRLRHFELISIQPRLALMVLVTGESLVRQLMLQLPESIEQDELSRLADSMVPSLKGLTAKEIANRIASSEGAARQVLELLSDALRGLDAADQTEIRHSGLEKIVGQPDFADADLQSVLSVLRGGGFLSAVLPRVATRQQIQVFIGDETLPNELRHCGVVVATYGVDGAVTGLLGVLGPTRMSYWRTISSVRYIACLMSDLMADLYSASA
jgi:heat-inducible transcriptional repressor